MQTMVSFVGGLISSTLLDFFVHPALFCLFGLSAAERVVNSAESKVNLSRQTVMS